MSRSELTRNPVHEGDPTWSPDGSKIAFMTIAVASEIYVMNADGIGQRNLTRSPWNENWAAGRPPDEVGGDPQRFTRIVRAIVVKGPCAIPMTPSVRRGGRILSYSGNNRSRSAADSSIEALGASDGSCDGRRRDTSRCVARTADVSEMCPRFRWTDNKKRAALQAFSSSPLTDSNRRPLLPWTVSGTGRNPRQRFSPV
jgi:WD40-like Beta Propeller Repeat